LLLELEPRGLLANMRRSEIAVFGFRFGEALLWSTDERRPRSCSSVERQRSTKWLHRNRG
jgi:hypothetical protein